MVMIGRDVLLALAQRQKQRVIDVGAVSLHGVEREGDFELVNAPLDQLDSPFLAHGFRFRVYAVHGEQVPRSRLTHVLACCAPCAFKGIVNAGKLAIHVAHNVDAVNAVLRVAPSVLTHHPKSRVCLTHGILRVQLGLQLAKERKIVSR